MIGDTTNIVALKPRHREAPALHWEFTLNRENLGIELVVLDDTGAVVATVAWRHASTTPNGLDLRAAWEERVCGEPPEIAS